MKKIDPRRFNLARGPRPEIIKPPLPSSLILAKKVEKQMKQEEAEKKQEVSAEFALQFHCKVLIRYTDKGKPKAITGLVQKASDDEIEVLFAVKTIKRKDLIRIVDKEKPTGKNDGSYNNQ